MTFGPLAAPEHWETEETVDAFLASELSRGRLALVLGAGASFGFNLPSWDDLVSRLYRGKKEPLPTSGTATEKADFLRRKHFGNDRSAFAQFVRECLYQGIASLQDDVLLKSKLLQAIGAMLSKSARGTATTTISFNFDNILELYLEVLGLVVTSIDTAPAWNTRSDVEILHPHGLLPYGSPAGISKNGIVFTASDYLEVIGDKPEPWNSRMTQVLNSNTCIFLGLSGSDDRLMSLLQQVHKNHPAVMREGHLNWAVRTTKKSDDEITRDKWTAKGVALRLFDDYSELPSWLLSICSRAAKVSA